jgi:hypothetical protein
MACKALLYVWMVNKGFPHYINRAKMTFSKLK